MVVWIGVQIMSSSLIFLLSGSPPGGFFLRQDRVEAGWPSTCGLLFPSAATHQKEGLSFSQRCWADASCLRLAQFELARPEPITVLWDI